MARIIFKRKKTESDNEDAMGLLIKICGEVLAVLKVGVGELWL